jgi:type IV pilus assembly protein PilW
MNMHRPILRISSRGFSLLEALISLVVMLLIIGGATAIFVQNQRATTANVTLAMLRANLRFARETLSADLRPIGAFSKPATPFILQTVSFPMVNLNNSGSYQSTLGAYSSYDSSQPDHLRIVTPEIINESALAGDYSTGSTTISSIKINGTSFQAGDMILITNANLMQNPFDTSANPLADLFQACSATAPGSGNPYWTIAVNCNTGFNPSTGFANSYASGSALTKVRIWEYYIDNSDPNIPRLMRREVKGTLGGNVSAEVIAEYVEDFQLALGIDGLDGSTPDNNIQPAEWMNTGFTGLTLNQLANMRAIRVSLIGRTVIVPETMAGGRTGANDIYYRRPALEDRSQGAIGPYPQYREVITEVVQLRNMRPFPMQ